MLPKFSRHDFLSRNFLIMNVHLWFSVKHLQFWDTCSVTNKYCCKLSWEEALGSSFTHPLFRDTFFPRYQQLIFFYSISTGQTFCSCPQGIPLLLPWQMRVGPQGSGIFRCLWRAPNGSQADFVTTALAEASLPCSVPCLWRDWDHQCCTWPWQLCWLHTITNYDDFPVLQVWHGLQDAKYCSNTCPC